MHPAGNVVDGFDYGELGVDPTLDPELVRPLGSRRWAARHVVPRSPPLPLSPRTGAISLIVPACAPPCGWAQACGGVVPPCMQLLSAGALTCTIHAFRVDFLSDCLGPQALALRVSMEEERARQAAAAAAAAQQTGGEGAGAEGEGAAAEQAPGGEAEAEGMAIDAMDEDALLQQALALSMQVEQPTPAPTSGERSRLVVDLLALFTSCRLLPLPMPPLRLGSARLACPGACSVWPPPPGLDCLPCSRFRAAAQAPHRRRRRPARQAARRRRRRLLRLLPLLRTRPWPIWKWMTQR